MKIFYVLCADYTGDIGPDVILNPEALRPTVVDIKSKEELDKLKYNLIEYISNLNFDMYGDN